MTRITLQAAQFGGVCLAALVAVIAILSTPRLAPASGLDMRADAAVVRHSLTVDILPQRRRLSVDDTLMLPVTRPGDRDREVRFTLHADLDVRVLTPGVRLVEREPAAGDGGAAAAHYALEVPPGVRTVRLYYEGELDHPLVPEPGDRARGVSATPGTISEDGVFLAPASRWYPQVEGAPLMRFDMTVRMPRHWEAIGQGVRTLHERDARGSRVRWEEDRPQPGLYLIAGRYTQYEREVAADDAVITAMAFLRTPDRTLAARYLEATDRYLRFYSDLLGPYPYQKFALVENFWETGYGMPSFTLLGPTVIRLPFIADTSYPHEILHNWWGNGVYVDYATGNWAEGLTAYLADHLLAERRGRGAEARRDQLQRYADYVDESADFPLRDFRARHSPASEAVGYGKGMMLFHMLRLRLGDSAFLAGLNDLRRDHLFDIAGFDDVRRALARHAGGDDLEAEFRQWTEWTGAPELRLASTEIRELGDGRFEISATIEQVQPGSTYALDVPVEVTLASGGTFDDTVPLRKAREEIRITVAERPQRLSVDPRFDVFRRVDRREIPPAFSQAFGARHIVAVIPSDAPPALREAYARFADDLRRPGTTLQVLSDDAPLAAPAHGALWLLGWENRRIDRLDGALPAEAGFEDGALRLGADSVPPGREGAAFVTRAPGNDDLAIAWIGMPDSRTLAAAARKLPHYGRYGWIRLDAETGEVTDRGQWAVRETPLVADLKNTEE